MKVFFDTEFLDDGDRIHLISIGMVAEDGRELYAVNADMPYFSVRNHEWLCANVLPHLPHDYDPAWSGGLHVGPDGLLDYDHPDVQDREVIRNWVRAFFDDTPGSVELWAWYASYDFVVLAQLFGPLSAPARPASMPMRPRDLADLIEAAGVAEADLPPQPVDRHHALADARWDRDVHRYLTGRARKHRGGLQVEATLTRVQAAAVLRAQLSAGHGVRRSADLVEAERRIKDAVRLSVEALR